jgi:hypothetical protein
MSRGPWTSETRRARALKADLKTARVIERIRVKEEGFEPRADAAAALHRLAEEIASGPTNEWVKVDVKVKTKVISFWAFE